MTDVYIERKTPSGGGVEALKRQSRKAFIKVGILSGTGEHPKGTAGQTIAEIAWWNEFGTKHIPPRPFLRTGLRENLADYRAIIKTVLRNVMLRRMSANQALGLLGVKAVADVQAKITAISTPPNTAATIERKKSSNPLIDTGALRQHINWARID